MTGPTRSGLDNEAVTALVREHDRDRYWSALFAPARQRASLLALYAFNVELDHILSLVREPLAGQLRLQWWRDAVEHAKDLTKTGNPIADALARAIVSHDISQSRLLDMIDGRLPALFNEMPPGEADLKETLKATEGAVFELAAAMLGDRSASAAQAANHAGIAYGLTRMLARAPLLASRQKLFLPASYVESRGIDMAAVHRGETSASFEAALADLRGVANRELQRFRACAVNVDPSAWPAFLPLALVKPYLREMAGRDFDHLRSLVAMSPLRRFWRIWRAARRKTL